MSTALIVNGTTYNYPQTNDSGWGDEATNWASAVTSGMLQKSGGTFTLTAEVYFGATYGLKSVYYKSDTSNVASAGQIRLANTDAIKFRNSSNAADISLNPKTSDNAIVQYAELDIVNVSSTQTLTNKVVGTANRAVQTNTSTGVLETSSVTNTELGYVSGVTSAIQTQFSNIVYPRGLVIGGLLFNSTTVPPYIKAGNYEVNGARVTFTSDQAIAFTSTPLQSKQTIDSFVWYLVSMDNTGTPLISLYYEGAVSGATGTFTSITGAGTTKTINGLSGTADAADVTKILVITGNSGVNGIFKITGRSLQTYTFESRSTITGDGTGTYTVYSRINTFHGAGAATSITTDASIPLYTPSYGENGWSAGAAAWDNTKQGFYLTTTGLTGYRVIGCIYANTTPNLVANTLISHATGRNKNDNYCRVNDINGFGSGSTKIPYFGNIQRSWGCDYVRTTDTTLGDVYTLKVPMKVNVATGMDSGALGVSKNSTELTTSIVTITATDIVCAGSASGTNTESAASEDFGYASDVYRPHTDGGVSGAAKSYFVFTGEVM